MSAPNDNPVPTQDDSTGNPELPVKATLWWPSMEESRLILAAFDEGTEPIAGDENPEFLPEDPDPGDES